jgi:hypothetical protein
MLNIENVHNRIIQTINQYGFWQMILIILMGIIKRTVGISWTSFYIMHHVKLKKDNTTNRMEDFKEIRILKVEDFKDDLYKNYVTNQKRQIITDRLINPNIEGFGLFKDGNLACYGWIHYERLEITSSFSLSLPDNSALLFDDFCHPTYRRQGLHYLINKYRINRIWEKNIENIYVFVVKYNKPAIKTQRKCGLKIIKSFTLWNIRKKEFCTLKEIINDNK